MISFQNFLSALLTSSYIYALLRKRDGDSLWSGWTWTDLLWRQNLSFSPSLSSSKIALWFAMLKGKPIDFCYASIFSLKYDRPDLVIQINIPFILTMRFTHYVVTTEPPAFEVLPSLKRLKQRIIAAGRGTYDAVFMSGRYKYIVNFHQS